MTKFRMDNTEGYNEAELAELNAAWADITSHGAPDEDTDDIAVKSMLDNWSETLLLEHNAGKRGDDLVAWFYEARDADLGDDPLGDWHGRNE